MDSGFDHGVRKRRRTAAQGKGIRLWNLTTATISGFQLSPAGKTDWGPNQTLNDKDKEVDHDERLRITGVEPGRYDAKVSYRGSKQCFVRDIEIKADAVFSIADKDLRDCTGTVQAAGVAAPLSALSLACGYSQRHLTAVHFGCSLTHCAM